MEGKRKIEKFTDLVAWREAHTLVVLMYKITKSFPSNESFGITNQMRRAAVSITSNIAEGFSRTSLKEKKQFYTIAKGSLTELQSQLLIARDVGYLPKENFDTLAHQTVLVSKLLTGLKRVTSI